MKMTIKLKELKIITWAHFNLLHIIFMLSHEKPMFWPKSTKFCNPLIWENLSKVFKGTYLLEISYWLDRSLGL